MSIFDKGRPTDPVIDLYKKDVDVGLLRENLKLTVNERIQKLQDHLAFYEEVRNAAHRLPRSS